MADDASSDGTAKIAELVDGIRTCMLTTTDDEGHLIARPMAPQRVEGDGDLWFFSDGDTRKVDQIAHGAAVGVTFSSSDTWVSLSGTAHLVHDEQRSRDLWNPVLDAWFPDGPTTPGLTLVRVVVEGAQYWDTPGGRVATLLSFAKAKLTGSRYDGGESEVVDVAAERS